MKAVFGSCCFGTRDPSPRLSTASTPAPGTHTVPAQSAPAQLWKRAFAALPEHDRQTLDFGTATRSH